MSLYLNARSSLVSWIRNIRAIVGLPVRLPAYESDLSDPRVALPAMLGMLRESIPGCVPADCTVRSADYQAWSSEWRGDGHEPAKWPAILDYIARNGGSVEVVSIGAAIGDHRVRARVTADADELCWTFSDEGAMHALSHGAWLLRRKGKNELAP